MTSVNMIFFMGGPQLGEVEAGFVASRFASAVLGVTVSIVSGGIATLVAAAAIALATPLIREYESPVPVEETADAAGGPTPHGTRPAGAG